MVYHGLPLQGVLIPNNESTLASCSSADFLDVAEASLPFRSRRPDASLDVLRGRLAPRSTSWPFDISVSWPSPWPVRNMRIQSNWLWVSRLPRMFATRPKAKTRHDSTHDSHHDEHHGKTLPGPLKRKLLKRNSRQTAASVDPSRCLAGKMAPGELVLGFTGGAWLNMVGYSPRSQ